jgi:hypothetical protein
MELIGGVPSGLHLFPLDEALEVVSPDKGDADLGSGSDRLIHFL